MQRVSMSLAEQVAALPSDARNEVLDGLDLERLRHDWRFWGRPEQLAPIEDTTSHVLLLLTGRGWGKTRSAAEWVRDRAREGGAGTRIALIGRTAGDVRAVMVQGESGVLAVSPPSERPEYVPSRRTLEWPNGAIGETFSADVPDQLRGPTQNFAWCDELAAWNHVPGLDGLTAWQNAEVSTRSGEHPQLIVSTTPKRVPVMYELLERVGNDVRLIRGRTHDNAGNLSLSYMDFVTGMYEGTKLGEQELEGLLLEDLEGALFEQAHLNRLRLETMVHPMRLPLRIVAVDPSVAEDPRDECGIVVVGATGQREPYRRQVYVLEDASLRASPAVWAQTVVDTCRKWAAPCVVETNQGGALVQMAINALDSSIKVYEVHAREGKRLRAEPVAAATEKGRVHMVGWWPHLESQLTTWLPQETRLSPDRLDAFVYGVTALGIKAPKGFRGPSRITARSLAQRQLPHLRDHLRAVA